MGSTFTARSTSTIRVEVKGHVKVNTRAGTQQLARDRPSSYGGLSAALKYASSGLDR
jgi:hypothetical protein